MFSFTCFLPQPFFYARFLFFNHFYEVREAGSGVRICSERSTRWPLPQRYFGGEVAAFVSAPGKEGSFLKGSQCGIRG